ncbi:hypothetical protein [Nocardioides sp.]|uniref:hypothetical protein n=1 Tax=Nocardioides sp. TaxID=35761 RepID=UPI0035AFB538
MTRARTLTLWGMGISATVVLAACGGGGEDDPQDLPASASYGIETLIPAVAKAVGGEDYVHLGIGDHRGRAEVQVDLAWADEPELRALTGDEPGEFLEFRRVSGRMYVGGEAAGNTWTWLPDDDPRALGEDDDFDSGAASVLLALDVPGDYEALVDAVDKVENKGEEEMGGVAATHYLVTVDSQAWRGALAEHSVHRQFEVEDALLVDIWIDESSLPVRLEYSGTGNDDARIDYTSWGTPIAVVEPEDAEPVGSRSS